MKPLTIKQRQLSRAFLFVIFLIFAPLIVLYSFGYRLDDGLSFQKTGGVFIHSNISNASVFLDGEYVKDNGLFLRNILIQDLTPNKEYAVRIQKEGLQNWIKDLYVYPSIVSEGRVLMLPVKYPVREILPYVDTDGVATTTPPTRLAKPSNPEYVNLSKEFATTTKEELAKPKTQTVATTATPTIEVEKTKLELFFEVLNIEDYTKLKNLVVTDKEVSWLDNSGIKLYWIDEKSTAPYYYCGGLERECVTSITLPWNNIRRFDYFPSRSDVWIVLTTTGIYAVEVDDRSSRNIQTIYEGKNLDFRLAQGGRMIIKQDSDIFEINL